MTDTNKTSGEQEQTVLAVVLEVTGHLLGIGVTAVALLALAMPLNTAMPVFGQLLSHQEFIDLTIAEVAVHAGLATVIWVMFVFAYHQLTKIREVKTFKLDETGSVMAETIAVLPVMLLIIFGLAQVAVNNIAGMLANVAAYEGARSAWVWAPEANGTRVGSLTNSDVQDRARIAAALAMTPVAPGDYRQNHGTQSDEFESVREAIFNGQFMMGGGGLTGGLTSAGGLTGLQSQEMRMSKALDESRFVVRTFSKFSHAYDSVSTYDVNVNTSSDEVSFNFEYLHHQAFPVVGLIFGERITSGDAPGSRGGYYLRIQREVRLPMRRCKTPSGWGGMCPPNPTTP